MQYVYNAIRTPDGTVLESTHTHDYRSHVDEITKERYIIDGGLDYRRYSLNHIPADDLSVHITEPHTTLREYLTWGTYGNDGNEPLTHLKLSEMDTGHIKAVLELGLHPTRRLIMEKHGLKSSMESLLGILQEPFARTYKNLVCSIWLLSTVYMFHLMMEQNGKACS